MLSSDGESHMRTVIACDSSGSFSCLIQADRLKSVLSEATAETISLSFDNQLLVKCGSSKQRLQTADAGGFVPVPSFDHADFYVVGSEVLSAALKRTAPFIAAASTAYQLGGVNLHFKEGGKLQVSGVDGRRASTVYLTCEKSGSPKPNQVMVPSAAIQLIQNLLGESGDVHIAAGEDSISIRVGPTSVFSQLLMGRFPNVEKIVGVMPVATFSIPASSLCAIVRQAAIATSGETRGVELLITASDITATCKASDIGESTASCPISYSGDAINVFLDSKYLIQMLAIPGLSPIEIGIVDANSAVLFSVDNWKHVIMPLSKE